MRNRKYPAPSSIGSPGAAPGRSRALRELRLQLRKKGIADERVLNAMEAVPRHLFVDENIRNHAYDDCPLPIGQGQTISQPYIVARMTELLELEKGDRVLEIGTGSGYQAAVLAAMGCHVISLERIPELYMRAVRLLKSMGITSVQALRTDGTLGYAQAAPYERIIVTAGGPKIPGALVNQLADNGVMLIPVGERQRSQNLVRLRKIRGQIRTEILEPVVFVNLVGRDGWAQ